MLDVTAPVRMAEQAFAGKPHTPEMFDAARAYRKTLKGLISVQAKLAKNELEWILWHDGRQPEKRSWTAGIKRSLASLGKGCCAIRLTVARVGEERCRRAMDEWLVFPREEAVPLKPAGSNMLCTLVSYGVLAPSAVPVLARVTDVRWANVANSYKVLAAFEWVRSVSV
jgi:hypothetical protein